MYGLLLSIKNFVYLFLLTSLFSNYVQVLYKKTNFIDVKWRILLSEPPLLFYHFYWTSFWYIILIAATIVFVALLRAVVYLPTYYYIILGCVNFYYLEFYYIQGGYSLKEGFGETLINKLLGGAFNKIHPGLFYLAMYYIVTLLISARRLKVQLLLGFILMVAALFLGG